MDRMLGILKVKMSLEYPTFETAFESGLIPPTSSDPDHVIWDQIMSFVDTVPPTEPMYPLGDFNAHALGALSLPAGTYPCHLYPLHAVVTGSTTCGRGRWMWGLLQMRNLHVLNGCAHMQLHTYHTSTARE